MQEPIWNFLIEGVSLLLPLSLLSILSFNETKERVSEQPAA
jgi:hypothetical protein